MACSSEISPITRKCVRGKKPHPFLFFFNQLIYILSVGNQKCLEKDESKSIMKLCEWSSFHFLLAAEGTRESVGVAGCCCCRCCCVDEAGREAPSKVHPPVGSSPPTAPAQTYHSCCIHPASTPQVRQDPGQTPSYIFFPCCHKQSVTPPLKPPSTYIQNRNCKERPLPFPLPSPQVCSSQWVKNAIFLVIRSPLNLALRPKLFGIFQDHSWESSDCRSIVLVFHLHVIAHVQVGRGYLLPTCFDMPPFLRGPLPSFPALGLPHIQQ